MFDAIDGSERIFFQGQNELVDESEAASRCSRGIKHSEPFRPVLLASEKPGLLAQCLRPVQALLSIGDNHPVAEAKVGFMPLLNVLRPPMIELRYSAFPLTKGVDELRQFTNNSLT